MKRAHLIDPLVSEATVMKPLSVFQAEFSHKQMLSLLMLN